MHLLWFGFIGASLRGEEIGVYGGVGIGWALVGQSRFLFKAELELAILAYLMFAFANSLKKGVLGVFLETVGVVAHAAFTSFEIPPGTSGRFEQGERWFVGPEAEVAGGCFVLDR